MVSADLFQAFRWAENGASGEQRENNKRAGIEKESNMSIIAQWRPYFHCQRIQPTHLAANHVFLLHTSYAYLMIFFGNLKL